MREPTPILAAPSHLSGPPSPRRRARWLGFLTAMLAFNAYPIGDLLHRGLPGPAVLGACLGLTVLAGLWLRTMWLALATTTGFRDVAPWLGGVSLFGTSLALLMRGEFVGLMIYVSIAAAVSLPQWWVLPALVAATGIALLTDLPHPVHLDISPTEEANTVFTHLAFVFFLGLMMWFYRRAMLLIIELQEAREGLARLAVTEERLRFARDLHDLLGHSLSTISLKGQLARRLATDPVVAAEIADIETVTQQALGEIREAVTGYRQTTLTDELDSARAALRAAGLDVTTHLAATSLPVHIDRLLGWVIREAITNIIRHSAARTCRVRLSRQRDDALLEISDDGIGCAATETGGHGLTGLGERVSGAGGSLNVRSAPGAGFTLTVRLPFAGGDPPRLSRPPASTPVIETGAP